MDSTPSHSPPDAITASLRLILRGMMAALGVWRLDAGRAVLLYGRIGAIAGRIERLLSRFRAGRLWRVLDRTRRSGPCGRKAGRGPALSRKFGWLVQAGGHQAASFGTQLNAMLNEPEMIALLADSPQAGRVLRPLCRALAVELPGSPERPRPVSAGIRKRRARPKPEPFKIPLPRGVLTAARRQGFGKLC